MELIDSFSFNASFFALFISIFLALYLILFRQIIFGFFDPYNLQTNLAISASLAVYCYLNFFTDINLSGINKYYPLYFFELLASILITNKLAWKTLSKFRLPIIKNTLPNLPLILIATIIIFIIVAKSIGLTLLADDPSVAKTELFRDGGGILKRILEALLDVYLIALIYKLFNKRLKSVPFIFYTFAYIIILGLFIGSKSGLLSFFIYYSLSYYYYNRKLNIAKIFSFLFIAISYMIVVVFLGSDNVEKTISAILLRFAAYADNIFYFLLYEKLDISFHEHGIFNWLNHVFGSFFASIRIIKWDSVRTLGGEIFSYLTGFYDGRGPNSSVLVEAHVYAGPIGAGLYIFIITGIASYFRALARSLRAHSYQNNFFAYFLYMTTINVAGKIMTDTSFIGSLFIDIPLRLSILAVFIIAEKGTSHVKTKTRCHNNHCDLELR